MTLPTIDDELDALVQDVDATDDEEKADMILEIHRELLRTNNLKLEKHYERNNGIQV
jgi:hypothetical protein